MRYILGGWVLGFVVGFVVGLVVAYLIAINNSDILTIVYHGSMIEYLSNKINACMFLGSLWSLWGLYFGSLIAKNVEKEKKYNRSKNHFGIDYPEKG